MQHHTTYLIDSLLQARYDEAAAFRAMRAVEAGTAGATPSIGRRLLGVVAALLLLVGTLAAGSRPALAAQGDRQPVYATGDTSVEVGASTLHRWDDGVRIAITTSNFVAGEAVTLWWVVFNTPDGCSDGSCGADDLGNPAAAAAVLNGGGNVATEDGLALITDLDVGAGLDDSHEAEIHLVLRSHGQFDPAIGREQLGTATGGCPPNPCEDKAFAVHIP